MVGRGLIRGVFLVLFAARSDSTLGAICAVVYVVVVGCAETLRLGSAQVIAFIRVPPILGRGLRVDMELSRRAPAAWLTRPLGLSGLPELVAAVALTRWPGGTDTTAVVGLLLAAGLALSAPAVLAGELLRLGRSHFRQRVGAAAHRGLLELKPEVIAYFGSTVEWRYQIDMWLPVLERLGRSVAVLVRDPEVLRTLLPTTVPVVCVQSASALMQLDLPSPRVALYVGNTANNIHFLRRPGIRSVFVGHGDSDKAASVNPFARVYQEVWVAGEAGRDRYLEAGLGIPANAFVVVGRPQLSELPRRPDAVPRLTVLYAPTWEGWEEHQLNSSLSHLGPDLVRALLSRPELRVMYRPHPQTGLRDPATRRAHREVLRLMHAADARPRGSSKPALATRSQRRNAGDLLDDVTNPCMQSREVHDAAIERWTAQYWSDNPGHRILTSPAPELHACFAMADALIADISSVTTEFLAADRPYAVVNITGVAHDVFRRNSPSTSGGFVLDPDLRELDAVLDAARGDGDPTATAREQARRYVLGPRTTDPIQTFRDEVDRVCSSG